MISAPLSEMEETMAITFLGYLDEPEEMTSPKRRLLLGCDSSSDTSNLPTDSFEGHGVPAPWSIALVRGGDTQILGADGTWSSL